VRPTHAGPSIPIVTSHPTNSARRAHGLRTQDLRFHWAVRRPSRTALGRASVTLHHGGTDVCTYDVSSLTEQPFALRSRATCSVQHDLPSKGARNKTTEGTEAAIPRFRSGAERRAKTTLIALVAAAHNGTYACAREDVSPTTSNPRFERRPQWQIYCLCLPMPFMTRPKSHRAVGPCLLPAPSVRSRYHPGSDQTRRVQSWDRRLRDPTHWAQRRDPTRRAGAW